MALSRAVSCFFFATALILHAAEPAIEFSGVMTVDGKTRVAITDKASRTTEWIEAGREYRGYKILRYDAKDEALFVKKDGQESRLTMAAPKTPPTPSASPAAPNAPAPPPANAVAGTPAPPSSAPAPTGAPSAPPAPS